MKNKKLTVTIGIPAYNEGANIGRLLRSVLLQEQNNFILKKIIVISDGSIDNTVNQVKKIRSNKIFLINNKEMKGLNLTQNEILENATTDILVIFNGDTLPRGNYFLRDLIKPFYKNKRIGIVGARAKSINNSTFISRVLTNSNDMKESIAQKINNSNNVYLCHGQARAFSKVFYKNLKWPYDCPEDAYSYFMCLEKGFEFVYSKDTVINFSTSSNIGDHIKQSMRFSNGKKTLEKIFEMQIIKNSYCIPFSLSLTYLSIFLFKKPVLTTAYIAILLFIYFFVKNKDIDHSKFEIAKSSKTLPL